MTEEKQAKNPTLDTVTVERFGDLISTVEGGGPFDVRVRTIIEILGLPRMGHGELLRMELHHVDFEASTIVVPSTKTRRLCVVAITARTVDVLAPWFEARYLRRLAELAAVRIGR